VNEPIPLNGTPPLPGQEVTWEIVSGLGVLTNQFTPSASFTPICGQNSQLYGPRKEAVIVYVVKSDLGCEDRDTLRFSYDVQQELFLSYRYFQCDSCGFFRLDGCAPSDSFRMEVTQMPEEAEVDLEVLNREFRVCHLPDGEYGFRLINWGRCGVDTTELTRFIRIEYREAPFEPDARRYAFCPDDFPENFAADKLNVPDFVEGVWVQNAGPPAVILDSFSHTLQLEGLAPGNYAFNYINDEYDCIGSVGFIELRLIEDAEFRLRQAGLTNYRRYCVDLLEYNGRFASDSVNYEPFPLNYSFQLTSAPPGFSDSVGFLINENLLFIPDWLDTVFLHPGEELIYEFSSPNYRGQDNLFSMSFVDVPREGTYSLRVGTEFPCEGWKYDEIEFQAIYVDSFAPNAGTDQVLPCGQDSTSLAGNLVNGRWSIAEHPPGSGPLVMSETTGRNPALSDLEPGTYCFNYTGWVIQGPGCNGEWMTDEVKVVVGDEPPDPFELGPPDTICGSDAYTRDLPAELPPGAWSQLTGPFVSIVEQNDQVIFTPMTGSGLYSFVYTVENGCGSFSDTLQIVVKDLLLSAEILTRDSCISFRENFVFPIRLEAGDPTAGGVGTWSFNGVGQAQFTPNANSPEVDVEVRGRSLQDYLQFIWTVTHPECPNSDTDTLLWKQDNLDLDLSDNNYRDCSFDFPDTLKITAGEIPAGPGIEWRLVGQQPTGAAPQLINPGDDTLTVVFFTPGNYSFTIRVDVANDCDDQTITRVVNVRLSRSAGAAFAGPDQVQCGDGTFFLQGQPDSLTGQWEIVNVFPAGNDGRLLDSGGSTAEFIFDQPGEITLQYGVFAEDPDCGIAAIDEVVLSYFDLEIVQDSLFNCREGDFVVELEVYPMDSVNFQLLPATPGASVRLLNEKQLLVENLPPGDYQLIGSLELDNPECLVSDTVQLVRQEAPEPLVDSLSLCFSVPLVEGGLDLPWYTLDSLSYELDTVLLWSRPAPAPVDRFVSLDRSSQEINYALADLPGLYVFRYVFTKDGCETYIDYRLRLTDSIFIEFPDTIRVCTGDSIALQPNPRSGVRFSWSPPDFLDDPDADNPVWSGPDDQWIFVRYSASNDTLCFNVDSIFIDVLDPPEYELPPDSLYCQEQILSLEVQTTEETNVGWYADRDLQNLLVDDPFYELFLERSTKLFVELERNGCTVVDSIELTLDDLDVRLDADTLLCTFEDSLLLELEGMNLDSLEIQWLEAPGILSDTREEPLLWVRGDTSGVYRVSITSASGCSLELTARVNVSSLAAGIDALADPPTILPGSSSQLELISDCDTCSIIWSPQETLDAPDIANTLASPTTSTTYSVEQIDGPCSDTALVTVEVLAACEPPYIYIPNAFSPNGDNLNDQFRILGSVIEEIHVRIYNRWGEKVFESKELDRWWDGTLKGKKVMPDVYGYIVEVGCFGGEKYLSKGNVTVLY
jgi:gliding motility-associated-like protein